MFPCHIWKSTTLKTLLQQTLACNSYHSGRFGRLIPEPFIFTVRSRDTQQKQNKVWRGRRGRRETQKKWCLWSALLRTKGLVFTHQCGRHHPAIPPDSCRFLEPHRFPRSCSLEDRSLHREQTIQRHSQHARKQLSFSYETLEITSFGWVKRTVDTLCDLCTFLERSWVKRSKPLSHRRLNVKPQPAADVLRLMWRLGTREQNVIYILFV